MRIALFGGTFDPLHRGHLAIALAAADRFALDRVLLAPTGVQPLKLARPIASFVDRLAMIGLGCESDGRFAASDLDGPRADGQPNYTVDTLRALHARMPQATIFSLIGADSFLTLPRWKEPERLLELAEWIVVSRPGSPVITEHDLHSSPFSSERRGRIHLMTNLHEDVSSTELRQRLKAGDRCEDQLPPSVATYIAAHELYR